MHTQGRLVVGRHDVEDGRIAIGLKLKHFCMIAEVICFDTDDVNYEEHHGNAERFVKCWNTHDQLLEACKSAFQSINFSNVVMEHVRFKVLSKILEAAIAAAESEA